MIIRVGLLLNGDIVRVLFVFLLVEAFEQVLAAQPFQNFFGLVSDTGQIRM